MKCPAVLKGVQADRFIFLLEAGLDFEEAIAALNDSTLYKEALEKYLLELLRNKGDSWMYEQVKSRNSAYATEFRISFIRQIEAGKPVEVALNFAERKANTRVSFWKSETATLPLNKVHCPTNIRMVICSTNRLALTEEHYQKLLVKMWKPLSKVANVSEMPNILGTSLIPDPGYVRVVCADKSSVNWVYSVLAKTELWPNASICVMREKKFLESQIFSVCLPHSASANLPGILKNLRKCNPGLETQLWTVLTQQAMKDEEDSIQLHILIPREGDAIAIEKVGFELNFRTDKVKFTIPDDCAKTSCRIQFKAMFPNSDNLTLEEIFKIIEEENDFINTDLWSKAKRRKGAFKELCMFFMDLRSAEAIQKNNFEISYKSCKVTLTPLSPIMEYCKTRAS